MRLRSRLQTHCRERGFHARGDLAGRQPQAAQPKGDVGSCGRHDHLVVRVLEHKRARRSDPETPALGAQQAAANAQQRRLQGGDTASAPLRGMVQCAERTLPQPFGPSSMCRVPRLTRSVAWRSACTRSLPAPSRTLKSSATSASPPASSAAAPARTRMRRCAALGCAPRRATARRHAPSSSSRRTCGCGCAWTCANACDITRRKLLLADHLQHAIHQAEGSVVVKLKTCGSGLRPRPRQTRWLRPARAPAAPCQPLLAGVRPAPRSHRPREAPR